MAISNEELNKGLKRREQTCRSKLLYVFLILLTGIGTASAHEVKGTALQPQLTFAVIPQQTASKITRLWTPLIDLAGYKSGLHIEVITARDIPAFEDGLAQGVYDFAYLSAYHYIVAEEQAGYRALLRQKGEKLRGILVVNDNSPYQQISDLQGQDLAFPSAGAFGASILVRTGLNDAGVQFTPFYVSSHDSVYLSVARGIFAAGGGVYRTLTNSDEQTRSQLRIIWQSKGYTSHAIVSHPRIPDELSSKFSQAMTSMHEDPQGANFLAALSLRGFVTSTSGDWIDVRALRAAKKNFKGAKSQ